jgi:hypothetical protein
VNADRILTPIGPDEDPGMVCGREKLTAAVIESVP